MFTMKPPRSAPTTAFALPELLAPAGSLEKLQIAAHYGADAVYMGGGSYSLRAHAVVDNDTLATAVAYAHQQKIKLYVTINILAHNADLEGLESYLRFLAEIKVDGLIIADPGIFSLARKSVPLIPIHLSTQANITNRASALFWQQQGVERVNLARELSLQEIHQIRQAVTIKLELFVHGAICISYSGRCSLSLYLTGRDANLGNCAHPCRYRYVLEEEKRPGQFFPVEEDRRGTYLFNSKDLCLLHRLPELIGAGADSLKIEGRMKSIYYVGSVVRLYRAALDFIAAEWRRNPEGLSELVLPASFSAELAMIGSRGYTENFIAGPPGREEMLYQGIRASQSHTPVGVVRRAGPVPLIEMRNPLNQGETIEYMAKGLNHWPAVVTKITTADGEIIERANPGSLVLLHTDPPLEVWREHGLVRKKIAP